MPNSPRPYRPHRDLPLPKRASAAARGYGYRWQQVRNAHLKQQPLCVRCRARGRIVPASVVDHIRPHRGDSRAFWDPENHQSLCASCHSRKTATEDGGFGHARG